MYGVLFNTHLEELRFPNFCRDGYSRLYTTVSVLEQFLQQNLLQELPFLLGNLLVDKQKTHYLRTYYHILPMSYHILLVITLHIWL